MATTDRKEEADQRQLKLISVILKEASIDSPSFRASVNFFQNRLETFEDWIEKTLTFTENKFDVAYNEFQKDKETLLSELLPPSSIIENGLVSNQDMVTHLVQNFNKDYYRFITKVLQLLVQGDSSYTDLLSDLVNGVLAPYNDKRRSFELSQKNYDSLSEEYQKIKVSDSSISPELLREKDMQIFQERVTYLKSSLDLVETISITKLRMDEFLIDIVGVLKSSGKYSLEESGKIIELSSSIDEYYLDYVEWMKDTLVSAEVLQPNIQHAKKQLLDYTISQIRPSMHLKDYDIRAIDTTSFMNFENIDISRTAHNISGWLYMKTSVGKPAREVWIRRWCFIQDSVFGMFLLSSSKTCVEETDKFGIQLTTVRYDPDENRKFCLEVKILGNTELQAKGSKELLIVLQAGSLRELVLWLNTFHAAKERANSLQPNTIEYDISFKRFSPEFYEFASSATTSLDQALTTSDSNTKPLLNFLQSEFSEYDSLIIGDDKIYKFQLESTPVQTRVSQLAIFAHLYLRNIWLPNAAIANIWGTTHWHNHSSLEKYSWRAYQEMTKSAGLSKAAMIDYPDFYPQELRVADIQMRSIFFSIDQKLLSAPSELLLFKYSTYWCSDKKHRFFLTCFVTSNAVYCYINSMGFLCLIRKKLSDIKTIEIDKHNPKQINIYDDKGIYSSTIVYFSDVQAVAAKLQFIVRQRRKKHILSDENFLRELAEIDIPFREKKRKARIAKELSLVPNIKQSPSAIHDENERRCLWGLSSNAAGMIRHRREIQMDFDVEYHCDYDIASKGLAHILFGDKSHTFPACLFLARKDTFLKSTDKNFQWHVNTAENGSQELIRLVDYQLNMTDNLISNNPRETHTDVHRRMVQIFRRRKENLYYEVDQEPLIISIPLCRPFKLHVKYVITEPYDPEHQVASRLHMATSRSFLYVYYKVTFINTKDGSEISRLFCHEKVIRRIVLKFTCSEFILVKKVIRYYLERIGKHGKVVKAIKLCGTIEASKSKTAVEANAILQGNTIKPGLIYDCSIIIKVLSKMLVYRVANLILVITRALFGSISIAGSKIGSINKILLGLVMLSVWINLYLLERSSIRYWSITRASRFIKDYMKDDNSTNRMKRAISVYESDLLDVQNETAPFTKFVQQWAHDIEYDQSRYNIALERNKILVELGILQNMERELVHHDYKNFLRQELSRCAKLSKIAREDAQLQAYCQDCATETKRLGRLLL